MPINAEEWRKAREEADRLASEEQQQDQYLDAMEERQEIEQDIPKELSVDGYLEWMAGHAPGKGYKESMIQKPVDVGAEMSVFPPLGDVEGVPTTPYDYSGLGEMALGIAKAPLHPRETVENIWDFSTGILKRITLGQREIVRAVGTELQRVPHAPSPFAETPPTEAHKEYEKLSAVEKVMYDITFPLTKFAYMAPAFLSEVASIIIIPEEYPMATGEEFPGPGISKAQHRSWLVGQQFKGLWEMARMFPAALSYTGLTSVGLQPTREEMETWKQMAPSLFPAPVEAINELYENPEIPAAVVGMSLGALRFAGKARTGFVGIPKVGMADMIRSARIDKVFDKWADKMAESIEKSKVYNLNPTDRTMGLAPEINRILLDQKKNSLVNLLKEKGKEAVDIKQAKRLLAEEKLRNVDAPNIAKQMVAWARRGYKQGEEPLFRQWWMTPARIIPEIFHVFEPVHNMMKTEFAQLYDVWNESATQALGSARTYLGRRTNKAILGEKVSKFLETYTTEELNAFLTGEGFAVWHKGKLYEIFPEVVRPAFPELEISKVPVRHRLWHEVKTKGENKDIVKDVEGNPVKTPIDYDPGLMTELDGKLATGKDFWLTKDELSFVAITRALHDQLFVRGGMKPERYIDRYMTWLRNELMEDVKTNKAGQDVPSFNIGNVPRENAAFLPRKIFMRFFEARTRADTPPSLNVFESMPMYINAALKKIYYEPLMNELRLTMESFPENKKVYAQKWVDNVRGKRVGITAEASRGIERSLKMKPGMIDRASRHVASAYFHSMLGLALDSSLKNLTQLSLTLAKTDLPSFVGGVADLLYKRMDEPRMAGVLDEFQKIYERDKLFAGTMEKVADINMSPFQFVENVNRGVTYFAAKRMFMRMGRNEVAAHKLALVEVERFAQEFAKQMDRQTQYTYGPLGTSPYLQNPLYRTFGQFTSFPMKFIETMMDWGRNDKRALARYLTFAGLMSGGAAAMGFDVSEVWGAKILPTVNQFMRGVSPSGQAIMNIVDAYQKIDEGRRYQGYAMLKEELIKLFPSQRFIRKAFRARENADQGFVLSRSGNTLYKTTPIEQVWYALGLRQSKIEKMYDDVVAMKRIKAASSDAHFHWREKYLRAIKTGKTDDVFQIFRDAADDGVNLMNVDIPMSMLRPSERMFIYMSTQQKMEYLKQKK